MPIYEFECKNKKCKTSKFEELCKHEEIDKVRCPNCNSKKVEKLISVPNFAFAQPQDSSMWQTNMDYRFGHNLARAKQERKIAEEKSHMGANPYSEINDITSHKEGIFDNENDIKLM